MTQNKMKGKYVDIDIMIYVGFQGLRIDGVFTCSVSSHRSKHRLSRRLMFVLNAVLSSTTSQISQMCLVHRVVTGALKNYSRPLLISPLHHEYNTRYFVTIEYLTLTLSLMHRAGHVYQASVFRRKSSRIIHELFNDCSWCNEQSYLGEKCLPSLGIEPKTFHSLSSPSPTTSAMRGSCSMDSTM